MQLLGCWVPAHIHLRSWDWWQDGADVGDHPKQGCVKPSRLLQPYLSPDNLSPEEDRRPSSPGGERLPSSESHFCLVPCRLLRKQREREFPQGVKRGEAELESGTASPGCRMWRHLHLHPHLHLQPALSSVLPLTSVWPQSHFWTSSCLHFSIGTGRGW